MSYKPAAYKYSLLKKGKEHTSPLSAMTESHPKLH